MRKDRTVTENYAQIARVFVFIEVIPAKTKIIVAQLRDIRCAVVREVFGPYDIVVELEVNGREYITSTLREQIRSLDGVIHTVTCICIER